MTKKALSLSALNHNSSKEEEIQALRRLVDAVRNSGTYMEQLLSDGLCAWFEDRVRDDAACDIKAEYATTMKAFYETTNTERQIRESYGKEIELMKEAFQKEHASADTFQKELFELRRDYQDAIADCDKQSDVIQNLRWKVEVQARAIEKMKNQIFLIEHPEYNTATENDDNL